TALRDGLPPSIGQERAAVLPAGACLAASEAPPSAAGSKVGRGQAPATRSKPGAPMIGRWIGRRVILFFLRGVERVRSVCLYPAGGRPLYFGPMAYSLFSVIT